MNNELEKRIREDLMKRLEESSVSENKIITKLNLSKNTLFNWKKKIPDSIVNYFEISAILGKKFDEFGQSQNTNEIENDILNLLRDLDDETKLELKGVIKNYLFNITKESKRKGNKSAM